MSSRRPIVRDTDQIPFDKGSLRLVGGKALGLHQLKSIGAAVPPWATLTTDLFLEVCGADTKLTTFLSADVPEPLKKAERIRERIINMPLPETVQTLLTGLREEISGNGMFPVAVRSSAADEDSASLSFAGQMDSFLNLQDTKAFLDAVRHCWASLFGERAVLYRTQHGIDPWSAKIALTVQRMVAADVSGVLFTANPLTGNRQEMLVSSTPGLGEGLVAGTVEADTFILGTDGSLLRSEVAEKQQITVPRAGGGTEHREIDEGLRNAPSLDGDRLRALHSLGLKVQLQRGMPMDIEFACSGETIFLLQARPITTLKAAADQENFIIWDNSNIVESYSGVTTPLTFSFIRSAYFSVYCQFCEVIGVSRQTIAASRHVFENMLGLIKGRVYYNLLNWYRLVSLMPGFSYNRKFMEQMMGLQVISAFTLKEARPGMIEKYLLQLPRLLKVGLRTTAAHLTLQQRVAEFHGHFDRIYARYSRMDFDSMTPAQLRQLYRELEDEVLWKWKAPILNDFEAMIFYGILKRLTVGWEIDEAGTLQNDLLCGEGGIRSTRVTTELAAVARKIAGQDDLKSTFLAAAPEEALALLATPAFREANQAFTAYLRDYGVRSIDEMKLESVPIRDNPLFCISMIQNYLRSSLPDPEQQQRREQRIRSDADALLRKRLREKFPLSHTLRLILFRWVLKNTRNAIKNRENQRFCRAEAYSLVRDLFRAIGRNWQTKGVIRNTEDIFYLTVDEIWSFIGGTATSTRLQELADLRRREFEDYRRDAPEDHIETYGEVYLHESISEEAAAVPAGEDTLSGMGCCQGIVEKKVQVVLQPDVGLSLDGEIMVARQTDPGWVVLFPSVGGLIIEKGSMLSHSAIVAREMGIPTVVGVRGATKILRTGDVVRLDGSSGVIRIVSRANPDQQ